MDELCRTIEELGTMQELNKTMGELSRTIEEQVRKCKNEIKL